MIDYLLLHESIGYYKDKGYQRIEVPWMVSEYVDNITKPKGIPSFQIVHNSKCLVASGEQSFLELYMKRYLPFGTFITITPCYRFEARDDMHCKTFMKAELIKTDEVNEKALMEMIHTALGFYRQFLPDATIVKTDIFPLSGLDTGLIDAAPLTISWETDFFSEDVHITCPSYL